jgi:hypothetical protein
MASIPNNGYAAVMAGSNVYTGSNLYGSICPQTPIPPATPPDLVNKLYVDTLVGPPSGVGLSQVLTVGNSATGQDILSVNNMTVQNIALNSAGGFTTITPIQIASTTYNSTCVFEGGSGISQLATPTPSDLNINNQGIGYDITINTSNNAPKGQFVVRCPSVPNSIRDSASSLGNAGQVLTSLGTGAPYGSFNPTNLLWQTPATPATPNIQQVLTAGSNAGGLPISNLLSVGVTNPNVGGAANPLMTLTNTNATGSVGLEVYKNKPTAGIAGDVLFNQSVYGKDSGNAKQEYTRITHTLRDGTAGVEDGSIEMGCFVNGSINTFLQLNGNENEVNCLKILDMGGNAILTRTGDITLDTGFVTTGNGNVVVNTVGSVGTGNITATAKGAIALTAPAIAFTGAALQSATAGVASGQHLVITLNGVPYKIALLNP